MSSAPRPWAPDGLGLRPQMRKTPVYARPGEACEARGSPREAWTCPPQTPAWRTNCSTWTQALGPEAGRPASRDPACRGRPHALSKAKQELALEATWLRAGHQPGDGTASRFQPGGPACPAPAQPLCTQSPLGDLQSADRPPSPPQGLPPCGQGPGLRRDLQGRQPRHARLPTASTGSSLRRRFWFPARAEMGLWESFCFPGSWARGPLPTMQTLPESRQQSVLGAPGAGPVTCSPPIHCGTGSRPLTGDLRVPTTRHPRASWGLALQP